MLDAALRKATADLAVDLGTSNTRLAVRGRGVVVAKQGNRVALGGGMAEKLRAEELD